MKILLFICLLLSGLTSLSQPVLLSTDIAPVGSSYNYKGLSTFSAIDTSLQGANQTWDFSTLTPDASPISTSTIFNPAQTIYADSFPTANYGILFLPNNLYKFYTLNSTQMELTGYYDFGSGAYTYFSNPQTQYVFPLSMGVNNLDTFVTTGSSGNNISTLNCIGWGTLLAPGHTYSNVLMRRNTIYFSSGLTVNDYVWYDSSNGMPVFSYTAPSLPSVIESAYYLYNISSSINNNDFASSLNYNNPFHSSLHLKLFSENAAIISYKLMNAFGEIIKTGQTVCNGFLELNFELENKPNGLYMLSLNDPANPIRFRLIKLIKI